MPLHNSIRKGFQKAKEENIKTFAIRRGEGGLACHTVFFKCFLAYFTRRVWFFLAHLVDHKPKFIFSLIKIDFFKAYLFLVNPKSKCVKFLHFFLLKRVSIQLYLHSTDLDVMDSMQSFVSRESTLRDKNDVHALQRLRDKNDVCIATLGQGHFLISK